MAETKTIPAPVRKADEEEKKDEKKEEVEKADAAQVAKATRSQAETERLLEKAVGLLEKAHGRIGALEEQIATMKAAPPEMDVQWPSGKGENAVNHDPTAEEAEGKPHPDNTTKPAKNTQGIDGAFVKKAVEDAVAGALAKQKAAFDKELEEKFNAFTPLPMGVPDSPAMRTLAGAGRGGRAGFAKAVKGVVQDAIKADRANSGGYIGSDNTESGVFGFKSGAGDNQAREATAVYLAKQFRGA